jgi:thiol-disulfide isomerase/thioredoxin
MKPKQLWLVVALMSIFSTSGEVNAKAPVQAPMPALDRATSWLNTTPLRAADLRGKVVLVDFWTYTCINWRRTLPWLREWDRKYKDAGLVVIGVHTPEFSFEHELENVRNAAREQDVPYPIVLDSNYAIWNAFRNQYWPAVYLVDAQGRIRHEQFGEGDYDRLESVIQQLLTESGHAVNRSQLVASTQGIGAEAAADWNSLRTPETYIGSAHAERFPGTLAGKWAVKTESAVSQAPNSRIVYRFHARDVHLVMGPAARGTPIRFRVSIDGKPPGTSHGVDVDAEGQGTLVEPRMYQLIRQPGPITERQIEIEFLDAGAQVFVFTFG